MTNDSPLDRSSRPTLTSDEEGASVLWTARWIWLPNPPSFRNQYVYARRAFELQWSPGPALLHVAAEYVLPVYVNGTCLGRGPARSEPEWSTYDTYDIGYLLVQGRNAIAIECNSCLRSRGALICQAEITDAGGHETLRIETGPSWRVTLARAYNPHARHGSKWEYAEIYDAGQAIEGWQSAGFDDSDWKAPRCLDEADAGLNRSGVDMAFPPHTHTPPFFSLLPRDIPYMRESVVLPTCIADQGEAIAFDYRDTDIGTLMAIERERPLDTCTIHHAGNLLERDGAPAHIMNELAADDLEAFDGYWERHGTYPTVKNAYLVLDFGRLVNGYFQLDVEGAAGSIVDIGYGQIMEDGRVLMRPYNSDRGGMANRYVLKEGRQSWEGFHYRNFRYVRLTFRNLARPLNLYSFTVKTTEYAAEVRGSFKCSDGLLTELWDAGARTLALCLQDSYMDNTFREKGIWAGCGSNSVLGAIATYGDIQATRRYFRIISRGQSRVGQYPRELPFWTQDAKSDYVEHGLRFALRICDYYWYGGDRELLAELYPSLLKYLQFLAAYRNQDGLLENIPFRHWIDWAHVDLRGAPLVTNLLYCELLKTASLIAGEYGRARDAESFALLPQAILSAIEAAFWNEERGFYTDAIVEGRQSDVFSEHGNGMALACGLGRDGRAERIIEQWKENATSGGLVRQTPSFAYFPLLGLFRAGQSGLALELIRKRFGRFRIPNAETTFWELWSCRASVRFGTIMPGYHSLAQSAGTSLPFLLSTRVLGVRAIAPGFTEFKVDPRWGDLDWAEGTFPSPGGDIAVSWRKSPGRYFLHVHVPPGSRAEVRLPSGDGCFVNDVSLADSSEASCTSAPAGGMTATVADGEFRFRVVGPTYQESRHSCSL